MAFADFREGRFWQHKIKRVVRRPFDRFERVGIGVGDPQYALEIDGDVNITGNYLRNGFPAAAGGGGSSLWMSTPENNIFRTGIRVGVGTDAPATRLHVVGDGGLTVDGGISAVGDVSVSGALSVMTGASLSGNVTMGNGLSVAGSASFSNGITVSQTMVAEGGASVSGTLSVTGDGSISGTANLHSVQIAAGGGLTAQAPVSLNAGLSVSGGAGLSVAGDVDFTGRLLKNGEEVKEGLDPEGHHVVTTGTLTVPAPSLPGHAVNRQWIENRVVPVQEGGTGATSFADNAVLVGRGGAPLHADMTLRVADGKVGIAHGTTDRTLHVGGDASVDSNLYVGGDLVVAGSHTTVTVEDVHVSNAFISLNRATQGETVNVGDVFTSGIEVMRGSLDPYQFVFDNASATFRVGLQGDTQAVATREDTPLDGGLAVWDGSSNKMSTSSDLTWAHDGGVGVLRVGGVNVMEQIQARLRRNGEDAMLGTLTLTSLASARGQLHFPSTDPPSSPVDGDVWREGDTLMVRLAGESLPVVMGSATREVVEADGDLSRDVMYSIVSGGDNHALPSGVAGDEKVLINVRPVAVQVSGAITVGGVQVASIELVPGERVFVQWDASVQRWFVGERSSLTGVRTLGNPVALRSTDSDAALHLMPSASSPAEIRNGDLWSVGGEVMVASGGRSGRVVHEGARTVTLQNLVVENNINLGNILTEPLLDETLVRDGPIDPDIAVSVLRQGREFTIGKARHHMLRKSVVNALGPMRWGSVGGGVVSKNMGSGGSAVVFGDDGKLYFGGWFEGVGDRPDVQHIAVWDGESWDSVGPAPGPNDFVSKVVLDGSLVYICGTFTEINGAPAGRVAVWNGVDWNMMGGGMNAACEDMALGPDGRLYVVGEFSTAGGTPARGIAVWDGAAWSAVGNFSEDASKVAVAQDGTVYVMGNFFELNGMLVNKIAMWDGSEWLPVGEGMQGAGTHITHYNTSLSAQPDGLYTTYPRSFSAAALTEYSSLPLTSYVAAISRWDGSSWSMVAARHPDLTQHPVFNGMIVSLKIVTPERWFVAGTFTSIGDVPAYGIAMWNGVEWSSTTLSRMPGMDPFDTIAYNPQTNTLAGALWHGSGIYFGVIGTEVSVWSPFLSPSPLIIPHKQEAVIEWNEVNEQWVVRSEARIGSYAFQHPLSLPNPTEAHHAATVDWVENRVGKGDRETLVENGEISGEVAITLLQGGDSFTIAAAEEPFFEKRIINTAEPVSEWFSLGGGLHNEWDGGRAIAKNSQGDLFFGGIFMGVGGDASIENLARWDGTTWHPFGQPNDMVYRVLVDESDNVYVSGWFTEIGGVTVGSIAKWDGTAWNTLAGGMDGRVEDMAFAPDGSLYAAGHFAQAGGVAARGVARWDGTQWHAVGNMNSNIEKITVLPDGGVVVMGNFVEFGGVTYNHIALWDGSAWLPMGTGLTGSSPTLDMHVLKTDAQGNVYTTYPRVFQASELPMYSNLTEPQYTAVLSMWDGTQWNLLGSQSAELTQHARFNGMIETFLIVSGMLWYASGNFTVINGVQVDRMARWNGSEWSSVDRTAVSGPDPFAALYYDPVTRAVYASYFHVEGIWRLQETSDIQISGAFSSGSSIILPFSKQVALRWSAANSHWRRVGTGKLNENGNDLYYLGGRIGIGTSSPQHALDVLGSVNVSGHIMRDGEPLAQWSQDGANAFRTDGNVGIGTSSPQFRLDVDGTIRATQVDETSDGRLKTNVEAISDALAKTDQIRGVTFDKDGRRRAGVIAQEVAAVLPEVVSQDADGYLSVSYGNLVSLLIEAVKEEKRKRERMEARFAAALASLGVHLDEPQS